MPEGRDHGFVIQLQHLRILPHEVAGKYAAGKSIELVRLYGLQQMQTDPGFPCYLFEVPAAAETFTAERFAD
ncbi:MAG TPA: hypothetical protein VFO27_07280 [Bryobacteraceae bacterium]|nr:hypothetical protein [Bryobacteraceae bacterium]